VSATVEIFPSVLDLIRRTLVGLKMTRALEVLDQTKRQLESAVKPVRWRSSTSCLPRNSPRARTDGLAGFDFSFQSSLDRNRVLALAKLDFIERNEVIHFVGPPKTVRAISQRHWVSKL